MKNLFFFIICIGIYSCLNSCKNDSGDVEPGNCYFKIDSLKQDTVIFAHTDTIYGTVRVYYTVFNDADNALNCYRYTINAMSNDSVYYQIAESHYHSITPRSFRNDSTKIGIGNCPVAYVRIDNILFQ